MSAAPDGRHGDRPRHLDWVLPALLLVGLIGIWEGIVRALDVPRGLMPAPSAVLGSLVRNPDLYLANLWVTLLEIIVGYLAALALGLAIGIGVAYSRLFEAVVYPLVVVTQVVPVFALAPLLLIWLGYGLQAKVVVIALGAFFPITVNLVAGMRAADPGVVALMRSYSAGEMRIFRAVKLPGSLPFLVPAAQVAMTYAVIGAVIAEWIGSDRGIGKMMVVSNSVGRSEQLFGAIAVVTVVALALYWVVRQVGLRLTPWDRAV